MLLYRLSFYPFFSYKFYFILFYPLSTLYYILHILSFISYITDDCARRLITLKTL
ncbi:hypothetical protein BD408DRAFT_149586 [Parasitella parasitica]|nr:hypothetical protein BD408DRAFT_149586 [Parasitella parasitica]